MVFHVSCINTLQWSKSGNFLISGSDDKKLNIYTYLTDLRDFATHQRPAVTISTNHTRNILSATICQHSKRILSGAMDSRLCLSDIETANVLQTYQLPFECENKDSITCLENDTVAYVATGTKSCLRVDTRMRLDYATDLARLPCVYGYAGDNRLAANCGSVCQHPNRRDEIYIGTNGFVYLYDIRQPKEFRKQFGPSDRTKPHHFPTKCYGTGSVDRFLATSIQIKNNKMLVNYLNNSVMLYDVDTERTVENPKEILDYNENIENSYQDAKIVRKEAKKLKLDESSKNKEIKNEKVKSLKARANAFYTLNDLTKAISLYTEGLNLEPHPVLFSNRSLCYYRRGLKDDNYAALLDCKKALEMDILFHKPHFRMIQCMLKLDYPTSVLEKCLKIYGKLHKKNRENSEFLELKRQIESRKEHEMEGEEYDREIAEGSLIFDENFEFMDGITQLLKEILI